MSGALSSREARGVALNPRIIFGGRWVESARRWIALGTHDLIRAEHAELHRLDAPKLGGRVREPIDHRHGE